MEIEPEIIDLARCLNDLGITREQLVDIGILIGTDFNPDGFERIGPKTALKIVKEYGKLEDIPQIQEKLAEIDYKQIRKIFLEPKVANVSEIKFGDVDFQGLSRYLVSERNFSLDRVEGSLNRLKKAKERQSHTLEQWMN